MTIAIPLLDGSAKNPKSTSLGTVVFPGSGNPLVAPLSQHVSVTDPAAVQVGTKLSALQTPARETQSVNVNKCHVDSFKPLTTAGCAPQLATQSSAEDGDRPSSSSLPTSKWNPNVTGGPIGFRPPECHPRPPALNHPLNNASSLYALQYHFLARQQQMQKAGTSQAANVASPEYGSDEEIMEQRGLFTFVIASKLAVSFGPFLYIIFVCKDYSIGCIKMCLFVKRLNQLLYLPFSS